MTPTKLQHLKKFERPREKLENVGPANLTTAELIALLLGSGSRRYSVLQLAHTLVRQFEAHQLKNTTLDQLATVPGVGRVKAGRLLAAIELGKRITHPQPATQILSPADVLAEIRDIRQQSKEHLLALYLNARNELVHKETLTIGGLNFNSLEPRDVFAPALRYPCCGIILAHNHPSGDSTPSHEDREMTKELQRAGQLLGIEIVDHLVVSGTSWNSVLQPPPHQTTHQAHHQ